ncbi:MAG: hypothetical protein ACSLFJ_00355 [Immundisolibacter sp.]|uniref:hypothetical protein n=1 Tax=Immundisolibacter sp. TaxID=1934948 RepID=UPI003EE1CDD6
MANAVAGLRPGTGQYPPCLNLGSLSQCCTSDLKPPTLSCIPIVDSGRAPVGIISWRDILKSLLSPDGRPAKNQQ